MVADGAYAGNDLFHDLNIIQYRSVFPGRFVALEFCHHDAFAFLAVVDVLPDFFRYEWHERVNDLHQSVKEAQCGIVCLLVDRCLISGLDHFEIPAGELVGEEPECAHQGFA